MNGRAAAALLALLALGFYLVVQRAVRNDPAGRRTMLVLGSGGHTTELLKAMEYTGGMFPERCYVVADTDRLSAGKVPEPGARVLTIPRAREVHQPYLSSVFSTLRALRRAFALVARERPNLLVVNGPGTCLPLVVACWVYRLFGMNVRIISMEALTRARNLSLTTRLCYPFVDTHVVLWPAQARAYWYLRKLHYVNVFSE